MGKEIERKFLVDIQKWQDTEKPAGQLYRQGYLLTDPERTIRVRLMPESAFLTIKGLTTGATRAEYEYEIPQDEARELLDNFSVAELSKIRYKLEFDHKLWEIDEFLGDNSGLVVAEIELSDEDDHFTLPAWIGKEVTDQEQYYNSNLTLNPFKNWGQPG